MKKLTSLMLAFTMALSAFAGEKDNFRFGIRLGCQFSDMEGDYKNTKPFAGEGDWKRLIGPTMGFIFDIPVVEYFEIRPEINFGSQGNRAMKGDVVLTTWLGYVQAPLLFKGQYGNDKVRGFAQVGPQFGYGIFVFDRLRNGSEVVEKTSDTFSDRKWKSFDAGLAVGAGVEFPSAKNLELEVRYYKGFTDYQDNPQLTSLKNNSISLSLGVKF